MLLREIFWMVLGWHCYQQDFYKQDLSLHIEVWGPKNPGETWDAYALICGQLFKDGWTSKNREARI
jgi:hypothetical protein